MSYISNMAKRTDPYTPGEQPKDKKYIKLNTNENPYPPSKDVLDSIKKGASSDIRLYPPPECDNLKEIIAAYYDVNVDMVFTGNGSDEVLAFAYMALLNPKDKLYSCDITYSFYPVYAKLFDIEYIEIPLNKDFTIPLERFMDIDGDIILANPNAPTGICLAFEEIEEIVKTNQENIIIIDEAYIDFGGESVVKLTKKYDNLLVVMTMSKSRSLAGLRAGYAIGNKELINGLARIKNSFNSYTMTRITQDAAAAAFINDNYFVETTKKIIRTRNMVLNELLNMGFSATNSKANFIFISHESVKAEQLFKELREKGVLVRYFKKPNIDNCLRISIGTDEEMKEFLRLTKEILCNS